MAIGTGGTAGPPSGAAPRCAICGGGGRDGAAPLHMAWGVTVWLCGTHRSERFARRDGGRALAEALRTVWEAAGCMSARRERALEAHLRGVAAPAPERRPRAGRPGSYAWRGLRRVAEARWAAGEPPGEVIAELLAVVEADAGPGGPRPPSASTMRRWYREGRWRVGA